MNSEGKHVTFLLSPEKEKLLTTIAKPAKLEDDRPATGINGLIDTQECGLEVCI